MDWEGSSSSKPSITVSLSSRLSLHVVFTWCSSVASNSPILGIKEILFFGRLTDQLLYLSKYAYNFSLKMLNQTALESGAKLQQAQTVHMHHDKTRPPFWPSSRERRGRSVRTTIFRCLQCHGLSIDPRRSLIRELRSAVRFNQKLIVESTGRDLLRF